MECNLEFIEFTLKNERFIFSYPIRENQQSLFGIKSHIQGCHSCNFPKGNQSKKCAQLVERETPLEISLHGVRRAELLGQKGSMKESPLISHQITRFSSTPSCSETPRPYVRRQLSRLWLSLSPVRLQTLKPQRLSSKYGTRPGILRVFNICLPSEEIISVLTRIHSTGYFNGTLVKV